MNRDLIDRRRLIFSTTLVAFSGAATFGWAANAKDAEVLVTKLVGDINAVISSGNSEPVMFKQFEKIFKSYDKESSDESILGRIQDARNYLLLLGGIIEENKYSKEKDDFDLFEGNILN